MIQIAISALTSLFAAVPAGDEEWKQKTQILCEFATAISDQVLLRAGFTDQESGQWRANVLVDPYLGGNMDNKPADYVGDIYLLNVPSTLDAPDNHTYDAPIAHWFVFGKGRVYEWDSKKTRARSAMTYEEAARDIIFWLAIKILEICRKNRWDRISQLPDLFDRLAGFVTAVPTPSAPYKIQDLLLKVRSLEGEINAIPHRGVRIYNRLLNLGLERIGDVVTRSKKVLMQGHHHNFADGSVEALNAYLKTRFNMQLGMELTPDVRTWYEEQIKLD